MPINIPAPQASEAARCLLILVVVMVVVMCVLWCDRSAPVPSGRCCPCSTTW